MFTFVRMFCTNTLEWEVTVTRVICQERMFSYVTVLMLFKVRNNVEIIECTKLI
jgi:hypothetical protein